MGASAEESIDADTAAEWAVEFECAAQVSGERLIEITLVGCCPPDGTRFRGLVESERSESLEHK
jgi:hypothetical protein